MGCLQLPLPCYGSDDFRAFCFDVSFANAVRRSVAVRNVTAETVSLGGSNSIVAHTLQILSCLSCSWGFQHYHCHHRAVTCFESGKVGSIATSFGSGSRRSASCSSRCIEYLLNEVAFYRFFMLTLLVLLWDISLLAHGGHCCSLLTWSRRRSDVVGCRHSLHLYWTKIAESWSAVSFHTGATHSAIWNCSRCQVAAQVFASLDSKLRCWLGDEMRGLRRSSALANPL